MKKRLLVIGGVAAGPVEGIRASEVREKLRTSKERFELLDVREESEIKSRRIPGSVWIPLAELGKRVKNSIRIRRLLSIVNQVSVLIKPVLSSDTLVLRI